MGKGPRVRNLTGLRFGRLVVVSQEPHRPLQGGRWLCRCDCGATKICLASALNAGVVRSCGCLARDTARERQPALARRCRTHGLGKQPEYKAWHSMKQRCQKPYHSSYARYGGRGIVVDPAWESFERFYADMGPRPSADYTLDRIDNDGPYSPDNCRWATHREQQNNTRSVRRLTYHGETRSVSEWARYLGVRPRLLHQRLEAGWSIEATLSTPARAWRPQAE